MKTIADCVRLADQLNAVSDSPRLDTELLLAHVLQRDRAYLFTWPEKALSAEHWQSFMALFSRRCKGEPVAHILGEREFWSLAFYVDASTLIPRPDTELLVEIALQTLPAKARVLDLGTGTGAIAVALASERPEWELVAVDYSDGAVALARRNVERHGLTNVSVLKSDWCASVQGVFDLIVSNPPYIAEDDEHLFCGDVSFEPRSALVAENCGLADIALIAHQALAHLKPRGCLMVEHGWQQGQQVRTLFNGAGYRQVQTLRDYGDNERVTLGYAPDDRG